MLFISWLAANGLFVWATSKLPTDPNRFMEQSWGMLGAWLVLNLIFAGVWIF